MVCCLGPFFAMRGAAACRWCRLEGQRALNNNVICNVFTRGGRNFMNKLQGLWGSCGRAFASCYCLLRFYFCGLSRAEINNVMPGIEPEAEINIEFENDFALCGLDTVVSVQPTRLFHTESRVAAPLSPDEGPDAPTESEMQRNDNREAHLNQAAGRVLPGSDRPGVDLGGAMASDPNLSTHAAIVGALAKIAERLTAPTPLADPSPRGHPSESQQQRKYTQFKDFRRGNLESLELATLKDPEQWFLKFEQVMESQNVHISDYVSCMLTCLDMSLREDLQSRMTVEIANDYTKLREFIATTYGPPYPLAYYLKQVILLPTTATGKSYF